jgi:hypothetical protein
MPARQRKTKRKIQFKALVYAVDGAEKPYPVYQFANGKRKLERPRHNPFADA